MEKDDGDEDASGARSASSVMGAVGENAVKVEKKESDDQQRGERR